MDEIEVEKGYSNKQTAGKLRRLAESIGQGGLAPLMFDFRLS